MSIGTFGSIIFEVSAEKTRTFDEFKRKTAAKFEQHDIIGQKPKLEFIAPGLDEISFQIIFSAYQGINPLNEVNQLREIVTKGEYNSLVIGGKVLGNFVIESASEAWKYVDNLGNVFYIAADVSLKEYSVDADPNAKPTISSPVAVEQKVEQVKKKVEVQAKSTGFSAQNISDMAAVVINGVHDPTLAVSSMSSILTATQNLQTGSSPTAANSAYLNIGMDLASLGSQSRSDPMGAMLNVLATISQNESNDKPTMIKNIYGAKAAGSILLVAQQLKGVV